MIIVECPYCESDVDLLTAENMSKLIVDGLADFKCHHCNQWFGVVMGKEKIEVKKGD